MNTSKHIIGLLLLVSLSCDEAFIVPPAIAGVRVNRWCQQGYVRVHDVCISSTEIMAIIKIRLLQEEERIFKNFESKSKIDDLKDLREFIMDPRQDLHLFWLSRCVKMIAGKLNVAKYKELMNIIRNAWDKKYSNPQALNFLEILENFLVNINSSASITDPKYYLAIWYPFRNNVTGFVLNANSSSYTVGEIYNNQSFQDVNVYSAKMAAYVPNEFLFNLTQDLAQEHKNKLRIVMLFLIDDEKLVDILRPEKKIKQFVGITIPGICKKSFIPILHIFSAPTLENPSGTWAPFGTNYIDNDPNDCTLNKISFFGYTNEQSYEYQRKLLCLKRQSPTNSLLTDAWVTQSGKVFPEHFCMDEHFRIPQAYCASVEYGKEYSYNFGCFNNHTTSNNTEVLYSTYVECLKNVKDCTNEIEEIDLITFVDVYIYMQILIIEGRFDMDKMSNLFEKSLMLIQKQSKHTRQMTYICEFLKLFSFKEKKIYLNWSSNVFAYFNVIANDTDEGFILDRESSNSYGIKGITENKTNVDDSTDEADIIVLIPNRTNEQYECDIDFFVIYDRDYSEHDNYTCQSRILGVQHECDNVKDKLKLKIYFNIVDDKKMWYTKGYWAEVEVLPRYFALICISEPIDNICDSGSKLYVYQKYKRDFSQDIIIRRNKIQIDILSQLAVSMNPHSQKLYQQHYKVLEVIMLSGSAFSLFGISCIVLCAIFLKNWFRPRLYSIQLSLSYVLEIAFFLPSVQNYTHSHYLIFYYSILSQFTWMILIGHVQYMRFVKVFRPSQISTLKSLLIGWLAPAAVMGLSILIHRDCLKCNLCYKNNDIFAYFVIIPISLIILCNMIIYVLIMIKISNTKFDMTARVTKAKLRATIMFPFLFGISWICIFAVISPWPLFSLIGSYLFHIIVTSQGFILFIFVVLLDKDTINEWKNKLWLPCRD